MGEGEAAKSREVRVKVQWFVDGRYVYQRELMPRYLTDGDSYELTYRATALYDPDGFRIRHDDSIDVLVALDKKEV